MSGGATPNNTNAVNGNIIDRVILAFGRLIAWGVLFLVVAIIWQVVLRYGFHSGFIFFEELQWHLYALGIMFGLSYAQVSDTHIRVDVLRLHFSDRKKRIIEILGISILLLPFCWIAYVHGLDFVADSWRVNERSDAPLGLCCRWGIKAVLPLSFLMLGLAGLSRILHDLDGLFGWKLFGKKAGEVIAPLFLIAAAIDLVRHLWPVKEEVAKRLFNEAIMPIFSFIAG